MSPKIPRQAAPPDARNTAARPCERAARRFAFWQALALALSLPLTLAAQSPAPAQQRVRPRTVTPKKTEAPQPAPAPTPTPLPATAPAPTPTPSAPQVAETVDEDEVVRVDSNLVLVPASVVDSRGRAITDLKLDDFELRVDGQVKQISDVGRAETPVLVALLFDNSASLSAAREFEKKAAVHFFRSVVRPIDRAAVYSISTMPLLVQPLTSNVQRLVNTIEGFPKPEGATALFDTVAQAADYLRPYTGRKVIVLVSDGTDTVSDISFDDALNRVLRSDSQVYVVQTRQVEDPNLHDPVSEGRLDKLTEQTGGAVYVPRSVEDLDAAFTQIALDIGQQYLLSYYPQDERKDKYFRFISLRVKTRPNLRVRARKGFYPTSAQGQPPAHAPAEGVKPLSMSRDTAGPEFVTHVGSPRDASAAAPAPDAAPQGIVLARGDNGGTRRRGPADLDEPETAKPTVSGWTPIPENPVAPAPARAGGDATTRREDDSAGTTRAVNEAPAVTERPTPAPALTKVVETRIDTSPLPAPEAAGAKQKLTHVSGGVLNSKALSLPKPVYPPTARSVGAAGLVVVEVTVDETGKVSRARAVSGHPLLQKSAVQAALQARFSPTTISGEAVAVNGTIKYNFMAP